MRIDIGDTETESYLRTKSSTKAWLRKLIQHNECRVPHQALTAEDIQEEPETAEIIDVVALPIETAPVSIEAIKRVVCNHFGLSHNDIVSKRRSKDVVVPRQIAIYLCREFTPRSYPEIGRRFGGLDHSTVIHAAKIISKALHADCVLARDVKILTAQLAA